MSLLLYMDENVEQAITDGVVACNLNVFTVHQDEYRKRPDSDILDRATELGRVIFTRDADFLVEAQLRQSKGIAFLGVIYCHKMRLGIGACIAEIELVAKVLTAEEMSNAVQFLPVS